MAGLIDLSSGDLRVFGKPVAGPPEGVTMVFQHFGLLPWKTVYQNAAFGLSMSGAPASYVRGARAALSRPGRPHRIRAALSVSAVRRHAAARRLVRALAVNPSILLMDEPFAALDAQTREVLQEELLQLMQRPDERKTMVFITHSIDEAIVLGDRIAVMTARPGRIKEVLEIPFGPPPATWRGCGPIRAFAELRAHIWRQLHTARPKAAETAHEVAQ